MPILDLSTPYSALHLIDDVGHTKQFKIRLSVSGEVRRRGELSDMIWSVPEVISSLSIFVELYLVDLVFTGTPFGVSQLNIGDRLEGEIENLAKLKIIILKKKINRIFTKVSSKFVENNNISLSRENYCLTFFMCWLLLAHFSILHFR